jgi:asparagine synthase (glutamine-hydrolysing)
MYRSTYLNRPHEPQPVTYPRPGVGGMLGEYLSDYWLPPAWKADPASASPGEAHSILRRKLYPSAPPELLRPVVRERIDAMTDRLIDRADELGLDPFKTLNYVFMQGRMRRDCTPLARTHQVMPLATPASIRASMQLTPSQKASRALHNRIIERLVPEWSDIPFVSVTTGVVESEVLRIWHGSGLGDLRRLLDRQPGGGEQAAVPSGRTPRARPGGERTGWRPRGPDPASVRHGCRRRRTVRRLRVLRIA